METEDFYLDELELWDYLASEVEELSKHKDILGDDFIDWE